MLGASSSVRSTASAQREELLRLMEELPETEVPFVIFGSQSGSHLSRFLTVSHRLQSRVRCGRRAGYARLRARGLTGVVLRLALTDVSGWSDRPTRVLRFRLQRDKLPSARAGPDRS